MASFSKPSFKEYPVSASENVFSDAEYEETLQKTNCFCLNEEKGYLCIELWEKVAKV